MGSDQPTHDPGGRRPKRRRPRTHKPEGAPVVRLDIYASSEGVGARPASPPVVPEPRSERAELDVDRRARELDASEAALADRARALDERERELAAREAELQHAHAVELDAADVERRRRRLAAQEEALSERTHEVRRIEQQVEERERALAEREAHIQFELDAKEDELDGREQALAEHEQRLDRKQHELTTYVAQLQGRLALGKSA
jgi:hypothetical protein